MISCVRSSVHPFDRLAWNYKQNFQPNCFISSMLFCTIYFYRFIPLSVTMPLAEGSQGQDKAKHDGFIIFQTFQLNGVKFGPVMKELKLNMLYYFLSEIFPTKSPRAFGHISRVPDKNSVSCLRCTILVGNPRTL